jgi:hypothetical protein
MDGSVHTVVETVKKLGDTLRDCFENNFHGFLLVGDAVLPEVNKNAPPLRFEYDINDYGDVCHLYWRSLRRGKMCCIKCV